MNNAFVVCPGCQVALPATGEVASSQYGATAECVHLLHALFGYTLTLNDGNTFRHQLAVDTYQAQHPGPPSRSLSVAFALLGLHLALEAGYLGRQVQQAHTTLARRRSMRWPVLAPLPTLKTLTVREVIEVPSGEARLLRLQQWAAAVWHTWAPHHAQVQELARLHLPELS